MNPKQIHIDLEDNSKIENDNCKYRNFEYQRVGTFKLKKDCSSFAFNTNNTILFVGQYNGNIKQLLFNNKAKLIQTIFTQSSNVVCLIWRKKSNSLISGHYQKIIIFSNNQRRPIQMLQPKHPDLKCIILNQDEDLLASGSENGNIQVWKKEEKQWVCSQIIKIEGNVQCLSFNSQNKLILQGCLLDIKDIDLNKSQIINDDDPAVGCAICYMGYEVLSPQDRKGQISIYEFNRKNSQFLISNKVLLQKSKTYFNKMIPIQFIKDRNILKVKWGKFINYFGKDEQEDFFFLKHPIQLGSENLFDRLSDDGLYQVTWDGNSSLDFGNIYYFYFYFIDNIDVIDSSSDMHSIDNIANIDSSDHIAQVDHVVHITNVDNIASNVVPINDIDNNIDYVLNEGSSCLCFNFEDTVIGSSQIQIRKIKYLSE